MNRKSLVILIFICSVFFAFKSKTLDYLVYKTSDFDIYYSSKKLENKLPWISELLDIASAQNSHFFEIKLEEHLPIFIFYGQQDFFENTIVNVSEWTGGVTEAFKNRLLVPFKGSKKEFQHVLNHEFIHEVQFNILYGGFWKTPRLLKSVFYPHWLMEGLAEYRAGHFIKTVGEMMVRDMSLSKKIIPLQHLHNFSHLKPHMILPAYEQSGKLMAFIEMEYGKKKVVDILKLYRENFDSNSVLTKVCGITLKELDKKFREEMENNYEYEVKINSMTDIDAQYLITKPGIYPSYYYSPVIYKDSLVFIGDPDGENVFLIKKFSENGYRELIPKKLLKKNVDIINTERISITDDGILCFDGIKNNKSFLFTYDIFSKKFKRYEINDVDFITSAYIANDGSFVAITAVKDSIGDVYIFNLRDLSLKKLTDDENYETQVIISGDKKNIAYAKEMSCVKTFFDEDQTETFQTDIFKYSLEKNEEERITSSISDEYYPCFVDQEKLIFTSDFDDSFGEKNYGVYNVFCYESSSQKISKLTNVIGGVFHPFYHDGKVYMCYYRNFERQIYQLDFNEIYSKSIKTNKNVSELTSFRHAYVIDRKNIFPYKFKFSTDLFLPFLYYSSYDGFATLLYWQGSDMINEHNLNIYGTFIGEKNLNFNLTYNYLRLKPRLFFSMFAEGYYFNVLDRIFRNYYELNVGAFYPIDRNNELGVILGYPYIKYVFENQNTEEVKRENIIYLNYIHNSISAKYIEPISGSYQQLLAKFSHKIFDGNYSYQTYYYQINKYWHLGKENSIFTKVNYIANFGEDEDYFSLGGIDRVRGLKENEIYSRQIGILTLGYSLPIVYDLNYYMWYLFPDFFFKGFYVQTFFDFGVEQSLKNVNSFGINLKFYSFILQAYLLNINFTFAKSLNLDNPVYFYLSISSGI